MYKLIKRSLVFAMTMLFCLTIEAQTKESVYFLFEDGKSVNCVKIKTDSYKRNNIIKVKSTGKMNKSETDQNLFFSVCSEKFLLVEDKEVVQIEEIEELNLVDFDYFIDKRIESDLFSKRDVFNKIYFLEKKNDIYCKYEVYWYASAHNKGL